MRRFPFHCGSDQMLQEAGAKMCNGSTPQRPQERGGAGSKTTYHRRLWHLLPVSRPHTAATPAPIATATAVVEVVAILTAPAAVAAAAVVVPPVIVAAIAIAALGAPITAATATVVFAAVVAPAAVILAWATGTTAAVPRWRAASGAAGAAASHARWTAAARASSRWRAAARARASTSGALAAQRARAPLWRIPGRRPAPRLYRRPVLQNEKKEKERGKGGEVQQKNSREPSPTCSPRKFFFPCPISTISPSPCGRTLFFRSM
jgi:hypothetical protein